MLIVRSSRRADIRVGMVGEPFGRTFRRQSQSQQYPARSDDLTGMRDVSAGSQHVPMSGNNYCHLSTKKAKSQKRPRYGKIEQSEWNCNFRRAGGGCNF